MSIASPAYGTSAYATSAFAAGPQETAAAQYEYISSGALVFAGAAALSKAKAVAGSGGIALSGAASSTKGKAYTGSGGIAFGGSAASAYVAAAVVIEATHYFVGPRRIHRPAPARVFTYETSGGIHFGGAAVCQFKRDGSARRKALLAALLLEDMAA